MPNTVPEFFLLILSSSYRRRHHPTSHRSSSFTLLQSLAFEVGGDKPTYSVLLGQLFAFIGTTPDQAVRTHMYARAHIHSSVRRALTLVCAFDPL